MKRIALMGAGATGTIMGALIAKGGEDIVLVSSNREHVNAMNKYGAKITGGMEITIPVKAITPGQMSGEYDLVIYAVKSTVDDVALPQILPHLHKDSLVLTTQNGVPEEKIASYVGHERTLGGSIVGWAASLPEPGVAQLFAKPEDMTYKIGELDGSITARIKDVARILDHAGKAYITENLATMRWSKLLINVSMSGLSTALGCTFGEILDNEKAINTALTLKVEVLRVAAVLGIQIESAVQMPPDEFLTLLSTDEERAREKLRFFFDSQRGGKPSMLQDLERGKINEVESINGYLSKKSAEAGVATPVNDKVTDIIRGIIAKKYQLTMDNLDLITLRPFSEIV